jgi:hypothetical protein
MKKKSFLAGLAAICVFGSVAFALTNSGWPYASQIWPGVGPKRNIVQFALGAAAAGGNSGFYPGVTNTNPLGSSSLRFSNVYTTLLNVSGAVTLAGAISGATTITAAGPVIANGGVTIYNSTAPRTATAMASIYTTYSPGTGTLFFNSTDNGICISTGLTQTTIAAATAPTTACGH